MPAITTLSFTAAQYVGRVLATLGRTLVVQVKRLDRALRNRQAARVLARFDDRMLADIGLTRADVADAYTYMWNDPTSQLRARALERRLAGRGTRKLAPEQAPTLAPKLDQATVRQARLTFSKFY